MAGINEKIDELKRKQKKEMDEITKKQQKQMELTQRIGRSGHLVMTRETPDTVMYIWRVPDIAGKVQAARDADEGKADLLWSPNLITAVPGYSVQMDLAPDGTGAGLHTHLSVGVGIVAGPCDEELWWPFSGPCTLQLLSCTEAAPKSVTATTRQCERRCGSRPPTGAGYIIIVGHELISHSELKASRGYVQKDGSVEIKLIIGSKKVEASASSGDGFEDKKSKIQPKVKALKDTWKSIKSTAIPGSKKIDASEASGDWVHVGSKDIKSEIQPTEDESPCGGETTIKKERKVKSLKDTWKAIKSTYSAIPGNEKIEGAAAPEDGVHDGPKHQKSKNQPTENSSPWKEALRKNRVAIVKNLDVKDVIHYLRQEKVVNEREQEEILHEKTREDQTGHLIDLVSRKRKSAYDAFCKSLEDDYLWLVNVLKNVNIKP